MGAAERFGAPAQIRSIELFHSLVSPPGNATMAVVVKEMRVYVDDSGDEPDPQHTVVALAAYMAEGSSDASALRASSRNRLWRSASVSFGLRSGIGVSNG